MILSSFDYFGARYYSSDISVWLSVDSLSDMYASTSPFMYVRGNPIMLIDPDGMRIKWAKYKDLTEDQQKKMSKKEFRVARRQLKSASRKLRRKSKTAKAAFKDLKNDDKTHMFVATNYGGYSSDTDDKTGNSINIINVERTMPELGKHSKQTNIMVTLAHEMGHAWRNTYDMDPKKITVGVNDDLKILIT